MVATSAAACSDLDLAGISYQIPEDICACPDPAEDARPSFEEFLGWLDALDRLLADRAGASGDFPIRPVRAYAYHLQLLVDSALVQWRLWSGVLRTLRPSSVTFCTEPSRGFRPDWQLAVTDEPPHRHLIPALCRERGVPCEVRLVAADRRSSSFARNHLVRHLAGRILGKVPRIARWGPAPQNGSRPPGPEPRAARPRTLLFLAWGWGLDEWAAETCRRGHRVLFTDGSRLYDVGEPAMRQGATLSGDAPGGGAVRPPRWDAACREALSGGLGAGWIRGEGRAGLAEYLLPRLRYVLGDICPQLLGCARTFAALYARERVDYVLTHSQVQPWQCAAMHLAAATPGIAAVQVTHGYDAMAYEREIYELPCNAYVTLDAEYAGYFRAALNARAGRGPVPVLHHPLWLTRYASRPGRARPAWGAAGRQTRPRVVFVPTHLVGDFRRLGEPAFPVTWYYRFQVELARHFAARPECEFVWKAPEAELVYNPLREQIAALGARNVVFRNGRLLDEYRRADRVITDLPSTPMIEALALGLPTLALAHQGFAIRPTAQAKFGPILHPFATVDEAKRAIDRFLQSDPAGYVVPVVEDVPYGLAQLLASCPAPAGALATVET